MSSTVASRETGRMVTVTAICGDITQEHVDAIVNAADCQMRGGGGVDGAIHRAGGPSILDDCIERFPNGLRTGDAGWTTAGALTADWVIHTVGPDFSAGERDRDLLESCYRRALSVADEIGARSLAFPLISAGTYAWPLNDAIGVAVETVARTQSRVREVRLVTLSEETRRKVDAQVIRLFPPPTDPGSIGELLDSAPAPPWGFRGDPYLWRGLHAHFAHTPRPTSADDFETLLRDAAESIVGARLTSGGEGIYVAAFDPGHGMSAGAVSPSWWSDTGFRILVDRFEGTQAQRVGDQGLWEASDGA